MVILMDGTQGGRFDLSLDSDAGVEKGALRIEPSENKGLAWSLVPDAQRPRAPGRMPMKRRRLTFVLVLLVVGLSTAAGAEVFISNSTRFPARLDFWVSVAFGDANGLTPFSPFRKVSNGDRVAFGSLQGRLLCVAAISHRPPEGTSPTEGPAPDERVFHVFDASRPGYVKEVPGQDERLYFPFMCVPVEQIRVGADGPLQEGDIDLNLAALFNYFRTTTGYVPAYAYRYVLANELDEPITAYVYERVLSYREHQGFGIIPPAERAEGILLEPGAGHTFFTAAPEVLVAGKTATGERVAFVNSSAHPVEVEGEILPFMSLTLGARDPDSHELRETSTAGWIFASEDEWGSRSDLLRYQRHQRRNWTGDVTFALDGVMTTSGLSSGEDIELWVRFETPEGIETTRRFGLGSLNSVVTIHRRTGTALHYFARGGTSSALLFDDRSLHWSGDEKFRAGGETVPFARFTRSDHGANSDFPISRRGEIRYGSVILSQDTAEPGVYGIQFKNETSRPVDLVVVYPLTSEELDVPTYTRKWTLSEVRDAASGASNSRFGEPRAVQIQRDFLGDTSSPGLFGTWGASYSRYFRHVVIQPGAVSPRFGGESRQFFYHARHSAGEWRGEISAILPERTFTEVHRFRPISVPQSTRYAQHVLRLTD